MKTLMKLSILCLLSALLSGSVDAGGGKTWNLSVKNDTGPFAASAVTIRFDYRFDGGYFSEHPERKRTLELAAGIWAELLPDHFERIAPGTNLHFRHPKTGDPLTVAMPAYDGDVLVFVFVFEMRAKASAEPLIRIDGYEDGRRAFTKERQPSGKPIHSLFQRANGIPFQPWAGLLNVNPNNDRPWYFAQSLSAIDDIPSRTHHDFLSTALHELGHVLGFIRDDSPFGFTDLVRDDQFTGARAVALDKRAIPLDKDSGHIGDYNSATWKGRLILARPHMQQYLMHGAAHPVKGLRLYPTELDLTMLEDIGYTVDWNHFRPSPYVSEFPVPQVQRPQSLVGLWEFRKQSDLNRAEIGYPLLYMPARTGIIEGILQGDCIQVPQGAFLYVDHGMAANGGGKDVNQYTVAFDIRLPKLGVNYALMNTNAHNENRGDVWINPGGQIGEGGEFSSEKLQAGQWYRVVFSADLKADKREYFINGKLVLTQSGAEIDKLYSINSGADSPPFFTLFADSEGDSAPIDVHQVALWNYTMSEGAVSTLGGPGVNIPK